MSIRLTGTAIMTALIICVAYGAAFSADETSAVTENWGKSYETAKKAQIANPEAGKDVRPVSGMDGQAAEKAVEGYHESFGSGQAPQNYNINLGDISGVGKK